MDIVPRAINGFAALLSKSGENYCPKVEAIDLFEFIHNSGGLLRRSLLAELENEGLLTIEPVRQDDELIVEMVRFTFERFSDHAIASGLLDDYIDASDPKRSFAKGSRLHEFVFGEAPYRRAGIIEAMAIQLPERTGLEILDVNVAEEVRGLLRALFRKSVVA